jgi:hypothetical protein
MPERIHMSHEEYVAKRRGQVIDLVRQAQNGEVDLLLAVRGIGRVLQELPELGGKVREADFRVLTGVSSECDDLPLGSERENWASNELREADVRATSYASRIRDKVLPAFARIAVDLRQLQ